MTYSGRATSYAEKVVAGEIPAAKPTRLACERHLLDLESQGSEGFGFYYDEEAAHRVCRFVEALPHTKGRWARDGEPFVLEDWQCFITCSVFGWKREADDLRRFRRVYIEVARKNGKSDFTARIGLYMLCADSEHGAEVYSGAGTEKQAWEVFGPARLKAKATAGLRDTFGVEVNARNLHILKTASKFEPVIGKPGDGASPSMAVHDEYHEHATEEQYDTMLTGMGAREQPLSWVITTAGTDTSGPCYALRNEVTDVLEGTVDNDELFGVIYTVDEEDEWSSLEALQKANPNMGVSVSEEYLLQRQQDAENHPRKQSTFKTKHLCVWTGAASPYFNLEKWRQLEDAELELSDFEGESCWGGLDLASKLDLTAYVKLFRREIDEKPHYYAFLRAYLPDERLHEPENSHYLGWSKTGDLVVTPGNITDYDEIEAEIEGDAERFRFVSIGFDPREATQLVTHLTAQGLPMVEIPQTTLHLSEPMKWVQALIEDGRLHHSGNPVFAWSIGNVTAQEDRNENVFPRKERRENKIDPAVALILATNRAMEEDEEAVEMGELVVLA